jgi:hypothetical protein
LRFLACSSGLGSGDEAGVVLSARDEHLGATLRVPSVLSFAEEVALRERGGDRLLFWRLERGFEGPRGSLREFRGLQVLMGLIKRLFVAV